MVNIPLVSATTLGSIGKSFYLLLQERAQRYLTRLCAKKASFGVDTGATWRFEAGAKITLNYTQQLTDEFEVTAKSDLFFNYWESISATDLNLDIIAIYKIRKAL